MTKNTKLVASTLECHLQQPGPTHRGNWPLRPQRGLCLHWPGARTECSYLEAATRNNPTNVKTASHWRPPLKQLDHYFDRKWFLSRSADNSEFLRANLLWKNNKERSFGIFPLWRLPGQWKDEHLLDSPSRKFAMVSRETRTICNTAVQVSIHTRSNFFFWFSKSDACKTLPYLKTGVFTFPKNTTLECFATLPSNPAETPDSCSPVG